jgi:DNA-binding NarL/FixJ family response regulator
MRVLIADDHRLMIEGVRAALEGAFREGASGYIVKGVEANDLQDALRQMLMRNVRTPVGLAPPATDEKVGLTKREIAILTLLANGASNRKIGTELHVTEQTVKFHLTNIYRKLGVANRTSAARAAYGLGLVTRSGR